MNKKDTKEQVNRIFWDLDEHGCHVPYTFVYKEHESFVFVIDQPENENIMRKKARILSFLDVYTKHLQKYVLQHSEFRNNRCLQLFASTMHTFYEIPPGVQFAGLNKPKNVHVCAYAQHDIGPDRNLRSHNRNVMLTVNLDEKGLHEVLRLYIHELAHTLSNHVRFRPNDHNDNNDEDFKSNERLFYKVLQSTNFFNDYWKFVNF